VQVTVGDARLSFDVEGAWLVPMGAWMVERPTVLVLGEPRASRILGAALAELAQVIYIDGDGDLVGFCAALEIERPLLIQIGEEDAASGELPTGFPGLVVSPGDPDAVEVACRFVQAFQSLD
jgi:hypothetical protein